MATTYSNPKEMLGYLIVQWIADLRNTAKIIYYDRKAPQTLIFEMEMLDSQVSTFRDEMYWYDTEKPEDSDPLNYRETMIRIKPLLLNAQIDVAQKNYDDFKKGIVMWMELIASSYPKLGLVPESGDSIEEEYNPESILEEEEQKKHEKLEKEQEEKGDNEDYAREAEVVQPVVSKSDSSDSDAASTVSDKERVSDDW